MIIFDPPELLERIKQAIKSIVTRIDDPDCDFIVDGYNVASEDFDPNEFADEVVCSNSPVTIGVPGCDDSKEVTYEDLIALAVELDLAELVNNVECWTPSRYLLRVQPMMAGPQTMGFLPTGSGAECTKLCTKLSSNDNVFVCSLVSGHTPFGFMVYRQGDYEDYYPSVLSEDLFVQVSFENADRREFIKEIAAAYLFELSATHNLDLAPSPRGTLVEDLSDETNAETAQIPQFRKLLLGKGMVALLELYNQAVAVADPETRILCFTKVLEYVSQTVVRMQLSEVVRAKLMSPRALDPSADFILELEALFDEQKTFRKDREAIIMTAQTCCEATELSRAAPGFLRKLSAISTATKRKELEDALREFGAALVASRNAFAHSKSNYAATGEECPSDELSQFADCVKIACQQAIRWYADRPESVRVGS